MTLHRASECIDRPSVHPLAEAEDEEPDVGCQDGMVQANPIPGLVLTLVNMDVQKGPLVWRIMRHVLPPYSQKWAQK